MTPIPVSTLDSFPSSIQPEEPKTPPDQWPKMELLWLERISGCVIYSEKSASKHPEWYRRPTVEEARQSHELNGCYQTVGHVINRNYKTKETTRICFFCGAAFIR